MVQVRVSNILVDFPYDPYPQQVKYMTHVIDALRAGHNALLESPTGTGKTLCLLCAALAWRSTYVAALQAHAHAKPDAPQPVGGDATSELMAHAGLRPMPGAAGSSLLTNLLQQAKAAGRGSKSRPNPSVPSSASKIDASSNNNNSNDCATPRIVYASRTHSQLSQVIAELKKTEYKPSMSVVASRDQLCIHDTAASHSGSRLNAMCRKLTAPTARKCKFHLSIASPRSYENRSGELVGKALHDSGPMDIEDLKGFGHSNVTCPYFLSRLVAQSDECQVLFLPYNYLIDAAARSSLDINWSNDILIIDEAHNLESVCMESASFDLPLTVRTNFDAQLLKLIENGLRPGGLVIPALENLVKSGKESDVNSVIGSENKELLEIRLIRSIFTTLEEFINNANLNRKKDHSDISFAVFPSQQLRNLLQQAGGPTVETYELYLQMFDKIIDMQMENPKSDMNGDQQSDQQQPSSSSGSNSAANNAVRAIQTAIRVLFESVISGKEHCFRTVIQSNASKPNSGRTLSYWCFDPSVAMSNLSALNTRCLLLTSGTLSPLDAFASELGLPFPVRLENPHVISSAQIWTGVIHTGPLLPGEATPTVASSYHRRPHRLTSAFSARGDESSIDLGRAIIALTSVVPDGVLVFYPSYSSLYACIDVWKRCGPGADRARPSVWEHLLRNKQVVVEGRDSSSVLPTILAHRANVDGGRGSLLLAVCRGKVSEGIDFSDEYGRAVFITGLPYPSAMDPKVVLKREFADDQVRAQQQQQHQAANTPYKRINGAQWYTTQALRAVNQAVGRAIRHRLDYGAILLCDERFQSRPLQAQISKWIRPAIVTPPAFANARDALATFFEAAARSDFARQAAQHRLQYRTAPRQRSSSAAPTQRSDGNDTAAVAVAQSAIGQLLPPPMTEAQFVDKMISISDEIKAADSVDRQIDLQRAKRGKAKEKGNDGDTNVRTEENRGLSQTSSQRQGKAPSASVVLSLNADTATSGMVDSGLQHTQIPQNMRSSQLPSNPRKRNPIVPSTTQGKDGMGQAHDNDATKLKRARLSSNDSSSQLQGGGGLSPRVQIRKQQPGKEKLSEKIKRSFDKVDVRPFLELFRQLLTTNSKMVDGAGPLQSERDVNDAREKGSELVEEIIKFTRLNFNPQGDPQHPVPPEFTPKRLLHDLRPKIPAPFQKLYDATITQMLP